MVCALEVYLTRVAVESTPQTSVLQMSVKLSASSATSDGHVARTVRSDRKVLMERVLARKQRVSTKATTGARVKVKRAKPSQKGNLEARKAMGRKGS